MDVNIRLQTVDDGRFFATKALLDCGSTGSCISEDFVRKNQIRTTKVARPIPIYNADGTENKGGPIREYVDMRMIVQDHVERIQFAVSSLGETDIFIGLDWLRKHNPDIDWRKSTMLFKRCPKECRRITTLNDLQGDQDVNVPKEQAFHLHDDERLFAYDLDAWVADRVATSDEGGEKTEMVE